MGRMGAPRWGRGRLLRDCSTAAEGSIMTAMYKACWALWIGGTVLIVASWAHVVPPTVGWLGFGAALVGTLLSFATQARPRPSEAREADSPSQPAADSTTPRDPPRR